MKHRNSSDPFSYSVVGNRPDRFEPRVRKRRSKNYKLMSEPRGNYKKRTTA